MKYVIAMFALLLSVGSAAASYEQKAKLFMVAGGVAMSGEKTLSLTSVVADFDTMTACNDAVAILNTPARNSLVLNGTTYKGQAFDPKVGTYGDSVTYMYRCVPAGYPMNY